MAIIISVCYMYYVKSLCFLWNYVYELYVRFSLLGIRLIPFVYMCRKIDVVAVRFMDAWRLCIGDERIQGVESSIVEDVVLFSLYSLYMYFPQLWCNFSYEIMFCFSNNGIPYPFGIYVNNTLFYEFSNKLWYFRKCKFLVRMCIYI